jgi:hypothetical protein
MYLDPLSTAPFSHRKWTGGFKPKPAAYALQLPRNLARFLPAACLYLRDAIPHSSEGSNFTEAKPHGEMTSSPK